MISLDHYVLGLPPQGFQDHELAAWRLNRISCRRSLFYWYQSTLCCYVNYSSSDCVFPFLDRYVVGKSLLYWISWAFHLELLWFSRQKIEYNRNDEGWMVTRKLAFQKRTSSFCSHESVILTNKNRKEVEVEYLKCNEQTYGVGVSTHPDCIL